MSEHHPDCYQHTGVPDDMPAGLCDCRVLRTLDDTERGCTCPDDDCRETCPVCIGLNDDAPCAAQVARRPAENDAPTCRTCYAQTLSKYELVRFFDAPVTGCVYYCSEHQRVQDDLMSRIDWSKVTTTRVVPPRIDRRAGGMEAMSETNWWDDRTMPNDAGPDWHRDAGGVLWQVDPRTGDRWKW